MDAYEMSANVIYASEALVCICLSKDFLTNTLR